MKMLFCDWNGTLLDDTKIWEKSVGALFRSFGKEPPTIEQYLTELESGDYMQVYRNRGIIASREELNVMYEIEYKKHSHTATLFPEVKETLHLLFNKRVTLALVTAQPHTITLPMLEKFEIESLFRHLSFHVLDKKTVIPKIITEEGINAHECYFIGDAPSDMRHAKKAGVQAVAFLNEHVPEDLLRATNPHHYVYCFSGVLKFL